MAHSIPFIDLTVLPNEAQSEITKIIRKRENYYLTKFKILWTSDKIAQTVSFVSFYWKKVNISKIELLCLKFE